MKKIIKSIIIFITIFLLYCLPGFIFKADKTYYYSLALPSYAPPSFLFSIMWPILFFIFSLYLTINITKKALSKEELVHYIINYITLFFFNKIFFIDHKLFLSFTITFLSFTSGLILFIYKFKEYRLKSSYIIPYLLWTLFASILMAHIYIIN